MSSSSNGNNSHNYNYFEENIKRSAKEINNSGNFLFDNLGLDMYFTKDNLPIKPGKECSYQNLYKICLGNTSLYFLVCEKYIFILDNVEEILGNGPSGAYFKTGNEFPHCIYIYYTKLTDNIHIDFIQGKETCSFGSFSADKVLDKIFTKIFAFLYKLNYRGTIDLDDDAVKNGRRIFTLKLLAGIKKKVSIYEKYGFKYKNTEEVTKLMNNMNYLVPNNISSTNSTEVYNVFKRNQSNTFKDFEKRIVDILQNMSLKFPEDVPYEYILEADYCHIGGMRTTKKTTKKRTTKPKTHRCAAKTKAGTRCKSQIAKGKKCHRH